MMVPIGSVPQGSTHNHFGSAHNAFSSAHNITPILLYPSMAVSLLLTITHTCPEAL